MALGRKNYLFAGSHAGVERAAMIYSLLGSCKLQNMDPYPYLQNGVAKITGTSGQSTLWIAASSLEI